MNRLLLCLVFTFVLGPAHAATYQVGPGRVYTQLEALTDAVDLVPGDVVEIDGDTVYDGDVYVPQEAGGAPGNPVVFRGISVNNARPHFRGGTNTIQNRANYVVFENIEITGTGATGSGTARCFFHRAHEVTLRKLYIHDCPGHGLLGADQGSGSLTMEYSEVFNIGADGRYHAIYMATDQIDFPGSTFRLQFSYIHDSQFDEGRTGGNLIKSRSERNEIYYNWLEGAYYHELELIGPDPGGVQNGWSESLFREDSDVVGNVILHTEPFGSILRFGGDATGQTFGRYRFVNNTVVRSGGGSATVFRLFDGIGALEAHNNVLWNETADSLRVIRESEAEWASGSTTIIGRNNWIQDNASSIPGGFEATVQGTQPGFTNATIRNFRPRADAGLVDGGSTATTQNGYTPADPLDLPLAHPPEQSVSALLEREVRGRFDAMDIGAFEVPGPELLFESAFENLN